MALFKCPECSNEVSDQAAACPKCGYPLKTAAVASRPETELDAILKQMLKSGAKIAAIKLYRERNPGAGLADSKKYVERLESELPPGSITTPKGCSSVVLFVVVLIAGFVAFAILGIIKPHS